MRVRVWGAYVLVETSKQESVVTQLEGVFPL